jgi:hypothetical protein
MIIEKPASLSASSNKREAQQAAVWQPVNSDHSGR